MHVGLVVYGGLDRTSGGFRYDRKLVDFLRARGDDVEVLALPWRTYPRHLTDAFSRSLRSRLNRPFDVLLQDELCHPSLWRHNRRLDRPGAIVAVVHHLRTDEQTRLPALARAIERRYLERVDAAICPSRHTRDRTTDLASVPTLVAPPGGRVGDAALSPQAVTARAERGPLRVAFVGNLIPRKGATTLLSALARVDREYEWRLTVVGSHDADPAYARAVRNRAVALGVADRVAFTGDVPASDLEAILERSHVLAVPARHEGFGMVYLEAMEYGVVPIASAVGGAGEVVADGRNGFLVSPDRPRRIADRLEALADDRDRLGSLGVAALETAADHSDWDETMARVRSFLRARVETDRDDASVASGDTRGTRTVAGDSP